MNSYNLFELNGPFYTIYEASDYYSVTIKDHLGNDLKTIRTTSSFSVQVKQENVGAAGITGSY